MTSLYQAEDFESFWRTYQSMHAHPLTRRLHAVATLTAGGLLITAVVTQTWWMVPLAFLADYSIAQASHRWVEDNQTQPWRRLDFHLRAELRMCRQTLCGR